MRAGATHAPSSRIQRRSAELFPLLGWLRGYGRADFAADALAGLTTAVMLIPQGMAYAMLAGMPPITGLYASLLPPLAYALLGTSRPLAVGPLATDSMLVAATLGSIAAAGSPAYLQNAVLLAAMVGVIQLALGLLGLGFVANFLARPVLSGFTSAAALIIAASQLGPLLALQLPRTHLLHRVVGVAFSQLSHWHLPTLLLGAGSIALLLALGRLRPRLPRAMIAALLGTALVAALGLRARGVEVVGAVPAGLPHLIWPRIEPAVVLRLLPGALTLALVAFVEAVSVGKYFARRAGHEIRPGRELVALGVANLGASVAGGFPISGGFARTAVNAQAGARTPLAGVITALAVALTLALLTPLFHDLPIAVLAAIVVSAVLGLFDAREARRLWRVKREDFWLLLGTFAATLGAGIQYGILIGVALSLLMFLVSTSRPHFALLGRIPGTDAYLNVARHPHAITVPGVLVLRIDAQFYFGNASFLKDTLRRLAFGEQSGVHAVVLDASGINQLDSTAEDALAQIDRDCAAHGVRVLFSHVKGPVRDVMLASGLLARLAAENRIHFRTHDAVLAAIGSRSGQSAPAERDPRAPADRIGCGAAPRP